MPRKKKDKLEQHMCGDRIEDCNPEPFAVTPDGESTVEVRHMRSPKLYSPVVKVKKLSKNARLPEKKSERAAAFDIYALEDTVLHPGKVNPIRTGISIELPRGKKGEIYSRSGLASKGISVANQPGKIDEDYRGEIIVLLRYDHPATVDCLDRIRKALIQFTKDFVSSNQFTIDEAKKQLKMKLENVCLEPLYVKAGDRIAQFEIQTVEPVVLEEVDELSDTGRGAGGFGSTGL